eukprot:COSAG02_NODE_18028_length_965_cov_0.921478_3_plen_117_part_01
MAVRVTCNIIVGNVCFSPNFATADIEQYLLQLGWTELIHVVIISLIPIEAERITSWRVGPDGPTNPLSVIEARCRRCHRSPLQQQSQLLQLWSQAQAVHLMEAQIAGSTGRSRPCLA